MSTCPGRTLELFVMWNLDLRVEGRDDDNYDANVSVSMAEILGRIPRRTTITPETFTHVVAILEVYRDQVEPCLRDYSEEDCGSWRDYGGMLTERIPDVAWDAARMAMVA